MSKSEILTINKIVYAISPKGSLFPIVNFNSTKELIKMNIDSVAFSDVECVKSYNLCSGAKVKVSFEKNGDNYIPNLESVISSPNSLEQLPISCPSCEQTLDFSDNAKCVNRFCSGQSRSMLYILIKLSNQSVELSDIEKFLNNYLVGSESASIDNIEEFVLLNSRVPEKNIRPREESWLKLLGESGIKMFNIELGLEKYLKSGDISIREFWSICNFPKITSAQLDELSSVNPNGLLIGKIDISKGSHLSKKTIKYLVSNNYFIQFLLDTLNSFGVQKWIN